MVDAGLKIDGYSVAIEHQDGEILRLYMGDGGLDIWPILRDEFKLKAYKYIHEINAG